MLDIVCFSIECICTVAGLCESIVESKPKLYSICSPSCDTLTRLRDLEFVMLTRVFE